MEKSLNMRLGSFLFINLFCLLRKKKFLPQKKKKKKRKRKSNALKNCISLFRMKLSEPNVPLDSKSIY